MALEDSDKLGHYDLYSNGPLGEHHLSNQQQNDCRLSSLTYEGVFLIYVQVIILVMNIGNSAIINVMSIALVSSF